MAIGQTGGFLPKSRAARLSAALAVVLAAAAPQGLAGPQATSPYTIVQETEVRIELRLILQGPSGARDVAEARLVGPAGKRLEFRETLKNGSVAIETRGTLAAVPRADGTGIDLTVVAESALAGASGSRVERSIDMSSGRVGLIDLWNGGPEGSQRLIAAVTITWGEVPRVVPISPGRQPIDLIIEMLVERNGSRRTVERHRLGSLVGRPVSYAFSSTFDDADTPQGELVV